MGNPRKFTVHRSTDVHDDFLAEQAAGKGESVEGLPPLSGYITEVRAEKEILSRDVGLGAPGYFTTN